MIEDIIAGGSVYICNDLGHIGESGAVAGVFHSLIMVTSFQCDVIFTVCYVILYTAELVPWANGKANSVGNKRTSKCPKLMFIVARIELRKLFE